MNHVLRLLPFGLIAFAAATLPAAETVASAPAAAPKQAGVDVPKPERVKMLRPTYPAEALARGQHALVVIELIIDEQGKVAEARVLHGPEPFAKAALEAARQWEYKPTLLNGKPVRVRETVPITFSLPVPSMKRDGGVPEMRQGVAPKFPASARGREASVVAGIVIDAEGRIQYATVESGESPFSEAVLEATRTWRFASPPGGKGLGFTVHAQFKDDKVALELKALKAGEGAGRRFAHTWAAPAGAEASVPTVADAPPEAVEAAPPSIVPPEPEVEVVSGGSSSGSGAPAIPADPASPPAAAENGISNIRDVELAAGIPDLVRGRRPASPPLARMGEIEGEVEVRFSIDSGGVTTVQNANGHETLKPAAESLVRSWAFRRTAAHRVFALALIEYKTLGSKARIRPVP
jgi:TonB family protein